MKKSRMIPKMQVIKPGRFEKDGRQEQPGGKTIKDGKASSSK